MSEYKRETDNSQRWNRVNGSAISVATTPTLQEVIDEKIKQAVAQERQRCAGIVRALKSEIRGSSPTESDMLLEDAAKEITDGE